MVSGNCTTFLLSGQKAEMAEVESSNKEKTEVKGSAICGTEESKSSFI